MNNFALHQRVVNTLKYCSTTDIFKFFRLSETVVKHNYALILIFAITMSNTNFECIPFQVGYDLYTRKKIKI